MPLPLYGSSRGPCRHSPGWHARPGRRHFRGRGWLTRTTADGYTNSPVSSGPEYVSSRRARAAQASWTPPRCTPERDQPHPPTGRSRDQPCADDGIGSLRIARREQPPRVTSPISGSLHATSARACADRNNTYRMSDRAPIRQATQAAAMARRGRLVSVPFEATDCRLRARYRALVSIRRPPICAT